MVKALEGRHDLLITDIKPPASETHHPFRYVDVTGLGQIMDAAERMGAILSLSVVRPHRVRAFDVNMLGCHNMMVAAVEHRI